jgi:hypothetical protein
MAVLAALTVAFRATVVAEFAKVAGTVVVVVTPPDTFLVV